MSCRTATTRTCTQVVTVVCMCVFAVSVKMTSPVFLRSFAQFVEISFSEVANSTQVVVEIFVVVYLQLNTPQTLSERPQVCSFIPLVVK